MKNEEVKNVEEVKTEYKDIAVITKISIIPTVLILDGETKKAKGEVLLIQKDQKPIIIMQDNFKNISVILDKLQENIYSLLKENNEAKSS